MRPKLALATALVGLAAFAPAALAQDDPVDESPFGGRAAAAARAAELRRRPRRPASRSRRATRFGPPARTDVIRAELAESPGARPRALIRGDRWQVEYIGRRDRGRVRDRRRDHGRGRRGLARLPGRDAARPRLRGRDRAEGERAIRLDPAEPALPRPVLRPAPPAAARPPGPARAARARDLALLLQPRGHHGLGAAHLSGARLLPRPRARRRVLAARARRPARAARAGALAGDRRGRRSPPGGSRSTSSTRT